MLLISLMIKSYLCSVYTPKYFTGDCSNLCICSRNYTLVLNEICMSRFMCLHRALLDLIKSWSTCCPPGQSSPSPQSCFPAGHSLTYTDACGYSSPVVGLRISVTVMNSLSHSPVGYNGVSTTILDTIPQVLLFKACLTRLSSLLPNITLSLLDRWIPSLPNKL